MSYYRRHSLFKRLMFWLTVLIAAVLIGAGVGIVIGRYYYPNVEAWDLALEDARTVNAELRAQVEDFSEFVEMSESAYYRGVMSACVGIGMQMGMPQQMVAGTCSAYWKMAYQSDWYTELAIDSWQFPPEVSDGN